MLTRLKQLLGRQAPQISILMVCTANICRSPMAQALLVASTTEQGWGRAISVDSAGLHVSVPGSRPDARARSACAKAGVDIGRQRARKMASSDFSSYQYILAMDAGHLEQLKKNCPEPLHGNIYSIMGFHPDSSLTEVPDPYFGNQAGFEHVFSLLEGAMPGLLAEIQSQLEPQAQ